MCTFFSSFRFLLSNTFISLLSVFFRYRLSRHLRFILHPHLRAMQLRSDCKCVGFLPWSRIFARTIGARVFCRVFYECCTFPLVCILCPCMRVLLSGCTFYQVLRGMYVLTCRVSLQVIVDFPRLYTLSMYVSSVTGLYIFTRVLPVVCVLAYGVSCKYESISPFVSFVIVCAFCYRGVYFYRVLPGMCVLAYDVSCKYESIFPAYILCA